MPTSESRRLVVLAASGAGLLLLTLLAMVVAVQAIRPAPQPAPTPSVPANVFATVNTEAISRADWQQAAAVDGVMSQLAGQPAPNPDATLQRLVNERLVMQQAAREGSIASGEQAAQRLAQLQAGWRVDDAALDRSLAAAGLSRPDLLAAVRRLLTVESYLKQVAAHQDASAWLASQRAQAQVTIYGELAAPAPVASLSVSPGAVPAASPTASRTLQVGVATGQLSPNFTLNDLNGQPVSLESLRGHPVVLNFWATWCPPCRQELAALQTAWEQYGPRGAVFLGVDMQESASQVRGFAGQFGLSYPLLLDGDGAVSGRYQVSSIPTSLFLDAGGVVRARYVGPLTAAKVDLYLEPLLPAVASAADTPVATPVAKLAPAFVLPRENGQTVRLSDYAGKSSVVLVFHRGQT